MSPTDQKHARGQRFTTPTASWRAVVFFLFISASSASAQEDELVLQPAELMQGAELLASIRRQPPQVDREVQLVYPDGSVQSLGVVQTDSAGSAIARAPLPDLLPGNYAVELLVGRAVRDSDPLVITTGPTLTLDPPTGFGGQQVQVQVDGLLPGLATLQIAGVTVSGPEAVSETSWSVTAYMPDGGQGQIPVTVQNLVGDRMVAGASTEFERFRTERTVGDVLSVNLPTEPFRRGELREITGQLALPDGRDIDEYNIKLVWRLRDGEMIPISVQAVEFTPAVGKGIGVRYDFSAAVVAPSVNVGFSFIDLDQAVDSLGFVAQSPTTEQTEYWPITMSGDQLIDLDDEQGIVITGRLIDQTNPNDATNGIEGAIVAIDADTRLINPLDVGKNVFDFFDKRGGSGQSQGAERMFVSNAAGMLWEESQLFDAHADLTGLIVNDFGCPITLDLTQTNANGNYTIAFSPELTKLLGLLRDREIDPISGTFVPTGNITRDQFLVRIAALHLDDAYGVQATVFDDQTFTGLRYEFRRDQFGNYQYREGLEGEFTANFNPATDVLNSFMRPVPPGLSQEIQSDIAIVGLDPGSDETKNGLKRMVFDGLITLPGQVNNPLIDQAPVTLTLDWLVSALGPLDGVVIIDGVGTFPLLASSGNPCSPGSEIVYSADLIGLSVVKGPITGRIEAVSGETLFFKEIEIRTIDGPSWFEGANAQAYEQPIAISWSPRDLSITATELPKATSASADIDDLGVGNVANDNSEPAAKVSQQIVSGAFGVVTRSSTADVTVFNKGGSSATGKLTLAGKTTAFATKLTNAAQQLGGARDELLNRSGEPTFGDKVPIVLFDSGKIPLFRQVWGVPPIAAATLGADLMFLVELLTFGYVDTPSETTILVNSIIEPTSSVVLDVFFDFSAVFGIVSATMTASPEIKIGMPIIVTNNFFNEAESGPCFQFLLSLLFEVSVGPCPFCVSGSYADTPVNESTPQGCSLLTKQSIASVMSRRAAAAPIADSVSLATSDNGLSLAVLSDTDGIHVQPIVGGITGPEVMLDAGPGAMQPAVSFYDADAAVAVWAQSSLTQSEYDQRVAADYDCDEIDLIADPDCDSQTLFNEAQFQHLVYAVWDGTDWSTTQNLTLPTTGEGGVQLASCKADNPLCPAGGEVLAVWHRDMAADLAAHQIKLFYATFDGLSWTAPVEIDPTSVAKDVQPAPVYHDGEPLVVWVRNLVPVDGSGGLRLSSRELVYQFLDRAAGTQVMPNVPDSVASPSAEVASNGAVVLSFTSSNSAGNDLPFVGTRRALYSGIGQNCHQTISGVCQWFSLRQLDQHGRSIYVEHPQVVLGANNSVNVLYRWLGTDGELLPGDPFGVLGFGDTAMHSLALPEVATTANVYVNALTADGNVNWNTAAVFDPAIDGILAVSAQGNQAAQLKDSAAKLGVHTKPMAGVIAKRLGTGRPVTLFKVPPGADLTVNRLSAAAEQVVGDDVLTVNLELANEGQPLSETTVVDVWWGGPPGRGELIHQQGPIAIIDALGTLVQFTVDVPSDIDPNQPQLMVVEVNPDRAITEREFTNNQASLTLNALPVPSNLSHRLDLAGTTVLLDWDIADDPRATHFRILRRDVGSTEPIQVGVVPNSGLIDVLARPGDHYEYCVTSMTRAGVESRCSDWYPVVVQAIPANEIFRSGFE